MENSYGISIKNKYELFLENDDPMEILREQERRAAAKKAEKSKKSSSDKDAKGSAKNKQNKTNVAVSVTPTTSQEAKTEKIETPPSLGKVEDKQKRQKSCEDETRLLKDRGNRQKIVKEEVQHQDESEKLEIGTFETRGPGSGTRERRGGRGRGAGFRNTSERSPKENFEGGFGPERRPRRGSNRGFRPNNYGIDRNGENQENGNSEFSHFEPKQNFSANGFGNPEERRDRQFNNEERRGFSGRRREDREGRPFGGFRRSYEGRPPRRNFAPRPPQEGVDAATADDIKASNFDEPQQEVGSFGHWGENSGGDEGGEMIRGRGRGVGRRSRGRGRSNFSGRREFNRRGGGNEGGGGIKPVEKRDGTGSHNWGTVMDDLEAQSEVTGAAASWADQTEAAENLENAGSVSAPAYEDESGAASALAEPAEPELETMTLDVYKATMEAQRLKMEFNIRKPNEGCSDDKWKKTYVLKKKEQVKGDDEEEEGEAVEDDKQGKSKNILPIEITFSDSRRGSRGRPFAGRRGGRSGFPGERGGFSGRRGGASSGMRGGEKKPLRERAPNVDDEKDFPSLIPAGAAQ